MRIRKTLLLVCLTLASIVFLLAGTEIALRVIRSTKYLAWKIPIQMWNWITYDPIQGWINIPFFSQGAFEINYWGFRGPAIELKKKPSTLRILTMGDS